MSKGEDSGLRCVHTGARPWAQRLSLSLNSSQNYAGAAGFAFKRFSIEPPSRYYRGCRGIQQGACYWDTPSAGWLAAGIAFCCVISCVRSRLKVQAVISENPTDSNEKATITKKSSAVSSASVIPICLPAANNGYHSTIGFSLPFQICRCRLVSRTVTIPKDFAHADYC